MTITLTERIDLEKMGRIMANFDELYDSGRISGGFDTKTYSTITDKKTAHTILTKFYNHHFEEKPCVYTQPKEYEGRHFSKNSLQGICKTIRHTVAQGMRDIDIKNAHPTILQHYCIQKNIDCVVLTNYITNRDKIVYDLLQRFGGEVDKYKTQFLKLLNGGAIDDDLRTIPILEEFKQEMTNIHIQIMGHEQDLVTVANKKRKDKWNIAGSVCNYMMCREENRIIECVYRYLTNRKIDVGTLVFDGLMIYYNEETETLCRDMEREVLNEIGISVHFVEKSMDEYLSNDLLQTDEIETPMSDEGVALYILDKIKDKFIYTSEQGEKAYLYNEETALYETVNINVLHTMISGIMNEVVNKDLKKKIDPFELAKLEKFKSSFTKNSFQSTIFRTMKNFLYLPKYNKIDFVRNHFDKKMNCLPIANKKVIELNTLIVRDRTKDDYFTITTDNEYIEGEDEQAISYFRSLLIPIGKEPTEDDNNYIMNFIKICGYMMTGLNNLKRLFIMKGKSDSGKSLFLTILRSIFGYFSVQANRKVFIQTKNEAVHNAEMFPLIRKRIATLSEAEENEKFNEQWIKAVSGNDREFSIRKPGGVEETAIIDASLLLVCNDIPNFQDTAFMGRMLIINFPNKFNRDGSKEREFMLLKNHIFSYMVRGAKSFNDNGFTLSEQMKVSTDEAILDKDNFKLFMSEEITITNNKEDKIKRTKFKDNYDLWCKRNSFTPYGRNKIFSRLEQEYNIATYRNREFIGICMIESDNESDVDLQ